MKYFLTSYPVDEEKGIFHEKNSFRQRFLEAIGKNADVVFVASDPIDHDSTACYASRFASVLEREGVKVRSMAILEEGNKTRAASLIRK